MLLRAFDQYLLSSAAKLHCSGFSRFVFEFLCFGIKDARACLFVGLFFTAIFLVPRTGLWGVPRSWLTLNM